ncbi:DUF4123 domain-containing protein [Pseudomonas aeruginosa]|uniref:DUF4123 domain-containing protein n=1 Tax=Pseudomonas aeruginosa TaxID=287 RepID=UPI000DA389B2|nr:DUF4123 domain-containing protein [Pseudomonas aeruginosa]RMK33593.1 hypothetical protein IPC95_00010 [Pseudomonas aeruginosa]SQL02644.1 Uncharacterised protein [Pseudomonas aeruginosa]HCE9574168.1 DUF4123 domain-containing protein [Pseudomonas aeruginosa]HCE9848165.1 DUF4123 domain-containing protein [Pseudomonas aeruginosa]HCF2859297.1 DUF4123 domain-containing protein [Pseudomonas aeruginosa]
MRTEPMLPALPADLPWTLNAYLLLDGVSVTELPRKLYQWSDTPTFEPLYRDSRWQELLDLSPCLVALDGRQDPILQAFLDNAAQEWGYLLFARVSLPILSQHLRDLLCVQPPHGEPVLLRLADPAVMHSLLEHERMELFGPIEQVCAPDALETRWWQHRRSGSAIARDRTQPYRLSEAEFDALGEVSFRQTLMDMDRHMNLYFPGYRPALCGRERFQHLRMLAEQAYRRGICSARDILLYANIFGYLGEDALDAHADIAVLLDGPSSQSPAQRVAAAAELAERRAAETERMHS